MDKIIVTVKRYAQDEWFDVELPAGVPVGVLAERIVTAFGWEQGDPFPYEFELDPPGRLMSGTETLAQAGIWDGTWLVFHKTGEVLPAFPTQTHIPAPKPEIKHARIKSDPGSDPSQKLAPPSPRQLPDLSPMPVPDPAPVKYQRLVQEPVQENKPQEPAISKPALPEQSSTTDSPLIGWRALNISKEDSKEIVEEEPRPSKYSWKRLDE